MFYAVSFRPGFEYSLYYYSVTRIVYFDLSVCFVLILNNINYFAIVKKRKRG